MEEGKEKLSFGKIRKYTVISSQENGDLLGKTKNIYIYL